MKDVWEKPSQVIWPPCGSWRIPSSVGTSGGSGLQWTAAYTTDFQIIAQQVGRAKRWFVAL